MPSNVLQEMLRFRELQKRMTDGVDAERKAAIAFKLADDYLDKAQDGPLWLKNDRIAEIVGWTILEGAGRWYDLFSFVVMANHVHVLLTPRVELKRITGGIKKKTAREINGLLGRRGQAFWQDESFDHWVRTDEKLLKILDYIENNPVKAGLCQSAEAWRWSSAKLRDGWERGSVYVKDK